MIVIIHAHPNAQRSVVGRALLDAVRDLPDLQLRSLYDLYPDFSVDVRAEREALSRARLIVWQHPLLWYSVPSLLKLWFDTVLVRGWAFGDGAAALANKDCLWVTTTGADASAYTEAGAHGVAVETLGLPVERIARMCGMRWLDPVVIHAAHRAGSTALADHGRSFRARLQPYVRHE